MIYIYFGKFFELPRVFVIKRLIYVEFLVLWKGKEKEKKKGSWKCRRPEWATAHFEAPVATNKICRDRVPWTLCHDRVFSGAMERTDTHDKSATCAIVRTTRVCEHGCDERKACCDRKSLLRQTTHSSSVAIENSLLRQRLLGPVLRHNFGVATRFGVETG